MGDLGFSVEFFYLSRMFQFQDAGSPPVTLSRLLPLFTALPTGHHVEVRVGFVGRADSQMALLWFQ